VEGKLACVHGRSLLSSDPHVSFVWHDCDLQLDGLGTVCLVRVFTCWRTGVGRALDIVKELKVGHFPCAISP
jgi:hypothetical protein